MRLPTLSSDADESGACEAMGAVFSVNTGAVGAIGAGIAEEELLRLFKLLSLLRLPLLLLRLLLSEDEGSGAELGTVLTEGSESEDDEELLAAVTPGWLGAEASAEAMGEGAGAAGASETTGGIVEDDDVS